MSKPRIIAFYLPQYHPTETNNKWYGPGFTEWTNVCKARRLFPGHEQPHVPGELGFYDLRLEQTRLDQAALAKEYGIEGFCYYYYRFDADHHELDLPFNLMVNSGKPDFPYMVCWANETWYKKMWNKDGTVSKESKILAEQKYLGEQDYINFFYEMLPCFKDSRYIKIDNKPAFMIYKALDFPDAKFFVQLWNELAKKNGLNGIYFISQTTRIENDKEKLFSLGFDSIQINGLRNYWVQRTFIQKVLSVFIRKLLNIPLITSYKKASSFFISGDEKEERIYPTIIPNWDHTPRAGTKGGMLNNSTPELFRKHLRTVKEVIKNKTAEQKIVFLMAWNEWGEGNYIEPDQKYGRAYLEVLKEEMEPDCKC